MKKILFIMLMLPVTLWSKPLDVSATKYYPNMVIYLTICDNCKRTVCECIGKKFILINGKVTNITNLMIAKKCSGSSNFYRSDMAKFARLIGIKDYAYRKIWLKLKNLELKVAPTQPVKLVK